MRSPFAQVLSKAAADAGPDKWPFQKGDAAHLARWLDDDRAEEIWQKLCPGTFDRPQAHSFVIKILSLRNLAEQLDQENQKVSHAKKTREKTDIVKLIREMSAQGIVITDVRDGALDSVETLEPFLAVRSDKCGTRRRTIFCRFASMLIYADTGDWHDKEVAALCEIACDCDGDVTVDMVRSAREAGRRDATRKSRRKV